MFGFGIGLPPPHQTASQYQECDRQCGDTLVMAVIYFLTVHVATDCNLRLYFLFHLTLQSSKYSSPIALGPSSLAIVRILASPRWSTAQLVIETST